MTALVTVAHGTRRAGGNEVARDLTARAGAALGVESVATYVELSEPLLADVVPALDGPAVVVPLLLSTGYHVRVDLPEACAGHDGGPAALQERDLLVGLAGGGDRDVEARERSGHVVLLHEHQVSRGPTCTTPSTTRTAHVGTRTASSSRHTPSLSR